MNREEDALLKENNQEIVVIEGVKYHYHPNGGGLVAEAAFVEETVYVGPNDRIEQGVHLCYPRVYLAEEEIEKRVMAKEVVMIEKIIAQADDLLKHLEEISGRD